MSSGGNVQRALLLQHGTGLRQHADLRAMFAIPGRGQAHRPDCSHRRPGEARRRERQPLPTRQRHRINRGDLGFGAVRSGLGCWKTLAAPSALQAKFSCTRSTRSPTPIGMGCKVCEREACPQRTFPFIGLQIEINENRRPLAPYAVHNEQKPG